MERFDLQATFPVHAWTSSQWLAHLSKLAEEFHATPDLYGDGTVVFVRKQGVLLNCLLGWQACR
jgi:hypothetical protein